MRAIVVIVHIPHHHNIIVCVPMTSPCSLTRSTTLLPFCKWDAYYGNDILYFGDRGPSAPWLRPWCYGSFIVLC